MDLDLLLSTIKNSHQIQIIEEKDEEQERCLIDGVSFCPKTRILNISPEVSTIFYQDDSATLKHLLVHEEIAISNKDLWQEDCEKLKETILTRPDKERIHDLYPKKIDFPITKDLSIKPSLSIFTFRYKSPGHPIPGGNSLVTASFAASKTPSSCLQMPLLDDSGLYFLVPSYSLCHKYREERFSVFALSSQLDKAYSNFLEHQNDPDYFRKIFSYLKRKEESTLYYLKGFRCEFYSGLIGEVSSQVNPIVFPLFSMEDYLLNKMPIEAKNLEILSILEQL